MSAVFTISLLPVNLKERPEGGPPVGPGEGGTRPALPSGAPGPRGLSLLLGPSRLLLDVFQRRRGNGGHGQALGFGLALSSAGWAGSVD